MTMRERMTGAVLLALCGVAGWFCWQLFEGDGLTRTPPGDIFLAVGGIVVLTSLFAGLAAATAGEGRRVDERDHQVAGWAQAIRGYFYLIITFGVLAYALLADERLMANLLFLAILGSEIVSGLVMLALYRRAA